MNFFQRKATNGSAADLSKLRSAHTQRTDLHTAIEPLPSSGKKDGHFDRVESVPTHPEHALKRLALAIDSGGIGIWDWDVKRDVMVWDDWMYRLYGTEPEDGSSSYGLWQRHLHPDDRAATEQAVADGLRGIRPYNADFRIVWKDGSIHHLRGSGQVTRDAAGLPLHMIGANWDITPLKQAEQARDELRAQFASILENMRGYIFQRTMSPDGKIHHPFISESLYQMLGFAPDPVNSYPDILTLISPLDQERVVRAIRQSARDSTKLEMELRLEGRDGRELWVSSSANIRYLDDGTAIWDGFGTDISVEKRTAHQLFYLTYHDKLTGLENRLGFESALENAVHEATRKQVPFVIFFIDIADFLEIIDTFGAVRGDFIIQKTAERLKILAGDGAITARIASDAFAVLKMGTTKDETKHLTIEIGAVLGELIDLAGVNNSVAHHEDSADHKCRIEVNIGIAGSQDDDAGTSATFYHDAVSEYMKRCDIALYEAKRLGRGKYCHYTHDIDHRIRNRMLLRQSLHQAVVEGEFILYYQPILDLQSGEIIAAEALVRWQHPKLGFQPPDQFIPLAEESGLIVPLGIWVLKTSMNQIRLWRQAFGLQKIAVNVSAVQFAQVDFVDMIENLLLETGASPDMIEFELTETTLIDCSSDMLERMSRLRSLGFTLAIDDFGTGYSSLKYLSKLPVDKLKIDQCFVRQMTDESNDATIVRAIVALGKGLNLEVFAEGVETLTQQKFLVAQGCFSGQGYLFSRPVPADEFVAFMNSTKKMRSVLLKNKADSRRAI